tara:strand:- start:777 stop:1187 length:411 start_codon:yes stop_codon:yes gene_type:complete
MNSLFFFIIVFPIIEILLLIKIGGLIGALNTVLLIFITAVVGVFFARIQGMNTLKSGFINIYQNKLPIFEIISGASIAVAAFFLILPGFISDTFGFLLLIPFSRKLIIKLLFKNKITKKKDDVIEAEIIEEKKDEL